MKVAFLGTGPIGIPSLRALAASAEHEICAVITQPDRPAGRGLQVIPTPIKSEALILGLPVHQPPKLRAPDAVEWFRELAPDIVVVVAYGQILPKSILDIPRLGCLNIHASLLPRHRGASPINSAILAGDQTTGVTIMWMDEGLDTGDALLTVETPIGHHETAGALHDRLAEMAPAPLLEALAQVAAGTAPHHPQDNALATHARKLEKADGLIDWTQPAQEIARRIRGLSPWPGASTTFPHRDEKRLLKVHEALANVRGSGNPGEIIRTDHRGIHVGTGKGQLVLRTIQAAGGKRVSASEFARGNQLTVGMVLGN